MQVDAPAIVRIPRRSQFSEGSRARAISNALLMARGITRPLPVIHGGQILGIAAGRSVYSDDVMFIPWHTTYNFGWTSYDALINDITVNGKIFANMWSKTATGAVVANNWYDMWPLAGNPANGSITNTAFTATQCNDSTTGSMGHGGNVSTDIKRLLSHWVIASAGNNAFMLVDRVLVYDQCTHTNTASQNMTNTNLAQRYNTGGPGLQIAVAQGPTLQGATATNLTTLVYMSEIGAGSHLVPTTPTITFIPSAAAATTLVPARIIAPITSGQTVTWGPFLPLANGDQGARFINNYVTSSNNTGNMTYALVHPLAYSSNPVAGIGPEIDQIWQIPVLERVIDGACLQYFMFDVAANSFTAWGGFRVAWGA